MTSVSRAGSPTSVTRISTVIFSPRRTRIRSTCSNVSLTGSRWIALGSASAWVPSLISMVKSWLAPPWRIAAANSRAGSAMCLGFSPWPYSTAGTRPARRVRRAPPLPNSVRGSALIFTSDTGELLVVRIAAARTVGGAGRGARAGQGPGAPRRSRCFLAAGLGNSGRGAPSPWQPQYSTRSISHRAGVKTARPGARESELRASVGRTTVRSRAHRARPRGLALPGPRIHDQTPPCEPVRPTGLAADGGRPT